MHERDGPIITFLGALSLYKIERIFGGALNVLAPPKIENSQTKKCDDFRTFEKISY